MSHVEAVTGAGGVVGRALGAASAITGSLLVVETGPITRSISGSGAVPPQSIVKALGGRYLVQGVAEMLRPTPRTMWTSCAVDGLHAASMAAAALIWPRYRNAALASLLLAVTSASSAALLAVRTRSAIARRE
jgi:hypothetical protein